MFVQNVQLTIAFLYDKIIYNIFLEKIMTAIVNVIIIVIAVLAIIDLGIIGDGFFSCTVDRLRRFSPSRV